MHTQSLPSLGGGVWEHLVVDPSKFAYFFADKTADASTGGLLVT